MRGTTSFLFLAAAGTAGISSAALTAVDVISASANVWDPRTDGYGCAPDACIASNAIDGSVEYGSRWSCHPRYSDDFEACEVTLELSGPQDVKEIRVALWKGDERTRLINVLADGVIVTTIESSGITEGYEPYDVTATQVSIIVLQAAGTNDETYNGWLSILDIDVMVESDLAVSPPSPAPTDDSYVGCFKDIIDDRIMSTVMVMDDLTSEACSAACRQLNNIHYALQQGNECWCAGCDLTDGDTNTAYGRHGSGSCSTACAGDSSSECGGDMTFSLFQTGNCGPTPAPAVATFDTDCQAGSTPFALQITLTYSADPDIFIKFRVEEPSGTYTYIRQGLGGVGVITQSSDETVITYTTMNGVPDAALVVGNYLVVVYGHEDGVPYALTARVADEVVLESRGVAGSEERDEYTVTVTEYAESDCKIEDIGLCPEDTFSSDGTPPCSACTEGRSAGEGATTCSIAAFENLDIPDDVAAAILADAVGGFAGPLHLYDITGHGSTYDHYELGYRFYDIPAEDGSTLQLTGKFEHDSDDHPPVDYTFPPGTALMVYVHSQGAEGLIVGQASLDLSTQEFSITVEDLPSGAAKVYFSFPVLDPDQTPQYFGFGAVFIADVGNNAACTSPLIITLEWDPDAERASYYSLDDSYYSRFGLFIQEPDGTVVPPGNIGNFGFSSSTAVADGMAYTVYGGVAAASGVYTARAYPWVFLDIAFTLTAEVNGETVWVEEGMWFGAEESSLGLPGWDDAPSPLGSFSVTLDSIPAC